MSLLRASLAVFLGQLVAALAPPASAQLQSDAQQRCIVAANEGAARIAKAFDRGAARCVQGAAPDLAACILASPQLARAEAALGSALAKRCGSPPDFGFTDQATLTAAVLQQGFAWLAGLFGPDLDAAIVGGSRSQETCRRDLVRDGARLLDAKWKAALKAKRVSLASGADSAEALALDVAAGVQADRGVGRKAAALLARAVASCAPSSLTSLFPGRCAAANVPALTACVEELTSCAFCLAFEGADAAALGCDAYDDGTANGSCAPGAVCGDGELEDPEECDDGNTSDGDGCSALCTGEPGCGDGEVQDPEECDDGNTSAGDGCSASCTIEPRCGDGDAEPPEECDDGNTSDGDGCSASCTLEPRCGDGELDPDEQCDDGNTNDLDGCTGACVSTILAPTLAPLYGSVSVMPGIFSDPATVGVVAGGPIGVNYLGMGCIGFTTAAPHVQITFTPGGNAILRVYALASGDTTLVVRTPAGSFACTDDSFGTTNPTVDINGPPPPGAYDVWVGSYTAGASFPATVYVTRTPTNHP